MYMSPTRVALRARRAERRDRSAPYSSSPAVRYPTTPLTATVAHASTNGNAPAPNGDTSDDLWAHFGSPPVLDNRAPLASSAAAFELRTITEENEGEGEASVAAEGITVDELAGKHHSTPPRASNRTNASKRAWRGSPSPTIEQRIRGRNKRARASLPDERDFNQPPNVELHKNPWILSSDGEGEGEEAAFGAEGPLAISTPVLRPVPTSCVPHVSSDEDFFLDNVNASGHPPTPHVMQNSSFLERLRRSAEEGDFRLKSISNPATDRRSHEPDRRTTMGGSSPLPPSSPIPSESPTRSSHPISDYDAHSLLKRNKSRFDAILGRTESSRQPREPRSRSSHEEASHAKQSARSHARDHAQNDYEGTDRRRRGEPPRPEAREASSTRDHRDGYVPLPNTRAAIYLQEQIDARVAEEARTGRASRRPDGQEAREEAARGPHRTPPSAHRSRTNSLSAMDISLPRPPIERAVPQNEPRTPSRARDSWLDTVLGTNQDVPPAQRAGRPRSPTPPYAESTLELPNILPTALTATAPEVDRPMSTDHRLTTRVHRDDPEALIRGTSQRWVGAVWSDKPRTSVLVEVFNFHFTDNIQTNRIMVETLRQATYLISGERQVNIVPPELEDHNPRRARDAPRVWTIRGLTPAGEEAMLSRFPWSFRAVSFFTYKRAVAPDTWIMALEGFFDENHQAIVAAIREVLEEDEQWNQLVVLTRDHPELRHLPSKDRANAILESIDVRTWRLSNLNVVANIHIRPPTYDIPKWREWAGRLRSRTYGNFVNGTGTVRRVSNCLGCNSVDHPAHLCPFHDLPGWKGPRAGAGTYSPLVAPTPPINAPQPTRGFTSARGGGAARGGGPMRGNGHIRGGGPRTPTWRRARAAPGYTRN